jgi:hypothetical protein
MKRGDRSKRLFGEPNSSMVCSQWWPGEMPLCVHTTTKPRQRFHLVERIMVAVPSASALNAAASLVLARALTCRELSWL